MKVIEPSIIDTATLRAEKARLALYNADLTAVTGLSSATISAILTGRANVNLSSIATLAQVLKLRVRVVFEPLPEEPAGEITELKKSA